MCICRPSHAFISLASPFLCLVSSRLAASSRSISFVLARQSVARPAAQSCTFYSNPWARASSYLPSFRAPFLSLRPPGSAGYRPLAARTHARCTRSCYRCCCCCTRAAHEIQRPSDLLSFVADIKSHTIITSLLRACRLSVFGGRNFLLVRLRFACLSMNLQRHLPFTHHARYGSSW